MKKHLTTDEQIDKLNQLSRLADEASASEDPITRLGAFTIYAGMVDFLAIQAARLIEQIIAKSDHHLGQPPRLQPHDDSWFYDNHISTRRILQEIEKMLPFQAAAGAIGHSAHATHG